MKIGLRKSKTDLSVRWVRFKINNEEHFVAFKFSLLKGFTFFSFDGINDIKITETSPPLLGILRYMVSVILCDLKICLEEIVLAIRQTKIR